VLPAQETEGVAVGRGPAGDGVGGVDYDVVISKQFFRHKG
jgi:hypothetical protein